MTPGLSPDGGDLLTEMLYGPHTVVERPPEYVLAAHPKTGVEIVVAGPGEHDAKLECVDCGLTVEGYAPELQFQKVGCPPEGGEPSA